MNPPKVLTQGDPSSRLYLVQTGRIKVARISPEGRQTTLRFMGLGDLIGCAAVFRKIPYPATATAVSAADVLVWQDKDFMVLAELYPRLARNALEAVSGRLQEFVTRIQDVGETASRRLASALLHLLPDAIPGREASFDWELALTRQDLAELTGATLYTVSRILSDWDRKGLVSSQRQRVVILDREALAAIATGT